MLLSVFAMHVCWLLARSIHLLQPAPAQHTEYTVIVKIGNAPGESARCLLPSKPIVLVGAEAMAPLLQRRKPLTGLCIVLADQTALASFLPTKHVFV